MSVNVSPAYLPECQSPTPARTSTASASASPAAAAGTESTDEFRVLPPPMSLPKGGELELMTTRFTNEELRRWMTGEISEVYLQACRLGYDVAKRAERAYRFEIGLADSNFIQFGYWDSLKKGLVSGEQLELDLNRSEHELFYQPCLMSGLGAVGTRVHATSSRAPGIGTVACRRSPSV